MLGAIMCVFSSLVQTQLLPLPFCLPVSSVSLSVVLDFLFMVRSSRAQLVFPAPHPPCARSRFHPLSPDPHPSSAAPSSSLFTPPDKNSVKISTGTTALIVSALTPHAEPTVGSSHMSEQLHCCSH